MSDKKDETISQGNEGERISEIYEGMEIPLSLNLRFIRKLSVGGMGIVWRARLISEIEQDVAVKVAREGFSESIKNEAECVVHLKYRTIARLLGLESHRGREMLIMEYVPGKNFADIIQMHNSLGVYFPEKFTGFIGWLVCEALNYGHNISLIDKNGKVRIGIIHGDISPQNIIAESAGGIKVVDYGISRIAGGEGEEIISGKLHYIAPEILEGGRLSFSSDIYNLGATLYHISFGKPSLSLPNHLEEQKKAIEYVQQKHSSGELERLIEEQTIKSGVISPTLGEIIYHAMRRDPAKRYGAVKEMQADGEEKEVLIPPRDRTLVIKDKITPYLYKEGFGPTQEALGKYLELVSLIHEGREIEEEKLAKAKRLMPYLFDGDMLAIKKKKEKA